MLKKLPKKIAVIHLPPLPGSPGAMGLRPTDALSIAGDRLVQEVKVFERAGFDGIILENFGDAPFYKTNVPPETLSAMSLLIGVAREMTRLPLGVNVLRNDARSALAIAAVTGCDWIRVNVLSGVYATDQGLIEGDAANLIRERDRLGVTDTVKMMADIQVKHAISLSNSDLLLSLEETLGRGGADAAIVTGRTTGRFPSELPFKDLVQKAKELESGIWVGSGVNVESLSLLPKECGFIVGSTLRQDGIAGNDLDPKRVKAFALAMRQKPKKKAKGRS